MESQKKRPLDEDVIEISEVSKPPPSKKPVSAARRQCFLKDYTNSWPCLIESSKGESFVHCSTCKMDFSCAHGGRHDCLRHVESQNHKKLSKSVKGTQSIAGCFQKQLNSDTDKTSFRRQVTRSEAMLCKMLVDLNQSINSADTFMLRLKDIFPDSGIAQAIQCGHSKTNMLLCIFEEIRVKSTDLKKVLGCDW
jgi:hypothetical protein